MYLIELITMFSYISLRQIVTKTTSDLKVLFYVPGSTYCEVLIHFFTVFRRQNDKLFEGHIRCTW